MPSTTMKANIEIMLMLTPTTGSNSRLPTKEIVMPIITQKASRISRKMARITSTMPMAMKPLFSSSDSRCS